MVPVGILAVLFGASLAGIAAVVAVLSANACGAFADSCDSYGEPAPEFVPALVVLCAGAALAVVGVVVALTGAVRGSVCTHVGAR